MQRLIWKQRLLMTLLVCACTNLSHAQDCEPHWSDQFLTAELDNTVHALATFDDGRGGGPAVYAGGNFSNGGDVVLNHSGKLEDNIWTPLGTGTSGRVRALVDADDGSEERMLIAAGDFSTAGGIQVNHIAKWDGQSWAALGGGLNNIVTALGSFDDRRGDGPAVYAGGLFTEARDISVNYIAKWDGKGWSPLGDGVNGLVVAMTVLDDGMGPALYVAGGFTQAGEVEANSIAKWNGEQWSAVGKGMDSTVRALVVFDDGSGPALYAGGSFATAGGIPANGIARWDGVSWSAVGKGVDGFIQAITVYDDQSGDGPALFAGGLFLDAGGVEASRIAKWDGLNWSLLDDGLDSSVWSLTAADDGSGDGPKLFVGGTFQQAGDLHSPYIAKWNGTDWSTTGKGFAGGDSITVVIDLESFDDRSGDGSALYAGGIFKSAGGEATRSIARWDGTEWSPVGGGMPGENDAVFDVFSFDDGSGPALYAGGIFQSAGGVAAKNVAKWYGKMWSALGEGTNGTVRALCSYDDGSGNGQDLYIAGQFGTALN